MPTVMQVKILVGLAEDAYELLSRRAITLQDMRDYTRTPATVKYRDWLIARVLWTAAQETKADGKYVKHCYSLARDFKKGLY